MVGSTVGAMAVIIPPAVSSRSRSEVIAGSLAALISNSPSLPMRYVARATPSEVVASICCTVPVSPPTMKMKRTTVPSGTRLPFWSIIGSVRSGRTSPTRKTGMSVGMGVAVPSPTGSGSGISSARPMT